MKIIVEAEGNRLVIEEDDLESFGLSMPSDVIQTGVTETGYATRELGRTHISLTGIYKEGFRPAWEAIEGE